MRPTTKADPSAEFSGKRPVKRTKNQGKPIGVPAFFELFISNLAHRKN
jgi:hypothetical protein